VSRLTWVRNQRIRFGFGYRTVTFFGPTFQTVHLPSLFLRVIPIAPRNPEPTRVGPVWAVPLSLATTHGIAACFLFLRVLRCFTSPGLPPAAMDSPQDTAVLPAVGFPIRTSTDRSLVSGSPWLFAATHVLHRLLEPRHPPHALSSLVTPSSGLPSENARAAPSRGRDPDASDVRSPRRPRCALALPFVFDFQRCAGRVDRPPAPGREVPDDISLVELIGVEPTTSSLQSWRSTN
jgi:hypothetical protein